MIYYLLTNPKFTCQRNPNTIFDTYANNPGDGIEGGRVNYPTLNPRNIITLDDLRALNLTADGIYGSSWDPLDCCIGHVQENFGFYFDRRFGQRDKSDEDKGEDEKIEEEIYSSDEDKESVKENAN